MENGNICTSELSDNKCTGEEITVTVDGTKPSSGIITINKGEIEKARNLYIDKKYINRTNNEIVLSDEKIEPICKAVIELSTQKYFSNTIMEGFLEDKTGVLASEAGSYAYGVEYTCDVGDGDRTFYVLEENDDKVSLIMNMNIDSKGKGTISGNAVAWCESTYDNSCDADGAKKYLESSTESWTKLEKSQISLPSADQIATVVGQTFSQSYISGLPTWLYENLGISGSIFSYWTSTPSNDSGGAWLVTNDALSTGYVGNDMNNGVRPVITIPKSQLG